MEHPLYMRIHCPYCGSKSYISHHTRPTEKAEELYCNCMNRHCQARFIYRAYYAHTITPPLETLTDSLHEQIAHLDPQERHELFQPYLAKSIF